MKIVQFKNGKYAIRKGCWLLGYYYKDLKDGMWWNFESEYFNDCLTDDIEKIQIYLEKPKIIKLKDLK